MTSWLRTDSVPIQKRPGILLGLSGLFILGSILWPVTNVVLTLPTQSCLLPDTDFALQWQHSVEKENWREAYQRHDQQLLLTHSQFKTYGAGTPSSGELHTDNNELIDYRVDRLLNELSWVVSDNVQSTLWIDGNPWPVHALVDDYTELDFRVSRIPFLQFLLMDSCHDFFRQAHPAKQQ